MRILLNEAKNGQIVYFKADDNPLLGIKYARNAWRVISHTSHYVALTPYGPSFSGRDTIAFSKGLVCYTKKQEDCNSLKHISLL